MKNTILFILLFILTGSVSAQQQIYKAQFSDKNASLKLWDSPQDFLSEESLSRRTKNNIPIDFNDLPVAPDYIKVLNQFDVDIVLISKWFNSAFFTIENLDILDEIIDLPFVSSIDIVKTNAQERRKTSKFGIVENSIIGIAKDYEYGNSWLQNAMINADSLHDLGYTGEGIKIAVLDGGFMGADTINVFSHLYEQNRVLGTKDFIDGGSVYAHSGHGTAVLSQMGALDQGNLIGTAPDAEYYLLRTEDVYAEYLMEEYYWAAAAEYADSAGVHIINSSLGYSLFDDPAQNHSYEDMDGQTTPITIAASLAASKGILVVTSAGNEGDDDWHYITAPADAVDVITVGAVKTDSSYASFSSVGPTFDGRIKPDIVALGQGNLVSTPTGGMTFGSGTSFASPLIAGLSACIMQADPGKNTIEIRSALKQSGRSSGNPSYMLGYGIADGVGAVSILLDIDIFNSTDHNLRVYPNPAFPGNTISIIADDAITNFKAYNLSGSEITLSDLYISSDGKEASFSANSQRGIIVLIIGTNSSLSAYKVIIN